ncbi:MAG: tryptophan synthase subunit alpha [Frateuria sp.]|uniref:tryptophan synthase subunit alpha n=1 Tax=Frateuria sp. TaxID=2211372 RepID=UPI0017D0986D|nr:tryptophan synthase subunit alpha [Frateuria sp.]NUO73401.1 tryptophan synthase subunit alpha [Frateuria sp.]NUR23858.1 tryptophan synthase subunit alpha [Frateuria sp.]
MNRIDRRFAALIAAGRTGLIPFVTAGDPAPAHVVTLMHALVDAGADLIELGVPFSDPMADGPVIQHASERAIAGGAGLADVLRWVGEFRRRDADTPVVLMGYLNPIEMYGYARFAEAAVSAGVDGVLIVDCPLEEAAALEPLRAAGLRRILLAAPTTAPARMEQLCKAAEGFLYYVSFAGITGAARLSTADIAARVAGVRAGAKAPVAVGFGVRDAASAKAIASFADAVVIGSALVERLAGATEAGEIATRAREFLAPIRAALDAP